ncbi:KEOPS complex subunit Bud32 [uncultured archaeon]|nr:KEOPS complex subunit Bud32 [uncultured archaeon]
MELVHKGAEAELFREGDVLLKRRSQKKYRIPEVDDLIRKRRTRREAKVLKQLAEMGVPAPKLISVDEKSCELKMEYIDGKKAKDLFEELPMKEAEALSRRVGELLKQVHDAHIIHNDLTGSNLLVTKKIGVHLIDWGLSVQSTRTEDKAMDLVVYRRNLQATHPQRFQHLWDAMTQGYGQETDAIKQVQKILHRGRYL